MDSYAGNVLRVDLSESKHTIEDLDEDLARDFIGGRGLGSKIVVDEVDPNVDPFDEDNKLIFAVGPLTGSGVPTGGRYMVITKSPLTGTITNANSGGHFGPEMKGAGYDMIIFEGKSPEPVYLFIEDDKIEIRSARELWGKTIHQTCELIKGQFESPWEAQQYRIACIGPAGEKLVRMACIANDDRVAGRSGVGAVMGSKNLKALVVKGTKGVSLHNKDQFKETLKGVMDKIKASPVTSEFAPTFGTSGSVPLFNESGVLPAYNFRQGVFKSAEKISGQTIAETILIGREGCYACPIHCGRVTKVEEDNYKGQGKGPEYETLALLGSNCGIDNLSAIAKANYICNDLGIDTMSAGGTIATAMELFDKGVISEKEVGFTLNFGSAEAMVKAVEMMGLREGFGDILAEGGYRIAEKYGHPEVFMGVKKQEFAGYDPRACKGMGLQFATCNRGACHIRGAVYIPELYGIPEKIDPLTTEGKAGWTKIFQDFTAIVDSAGMCMFTFLAIWKDEMRAMLNDTTGAGYTMEEMMRVGERIWNLERLFNLDAGFSKVDDTLPKRILEEPAPEGPAKGHVCELDKMLTEYYQLRGWDENGVPTKEKLSELNL